MCFCCEMSKYRQCGGGGYVYIRGGEMCVCVW